MRSIKDRRTRALKVASRPVIVSRRRFNLKEHPGTRGATQEDHPATGVHSGKPSVAAISPTNKTGSRGW